MGRIADDYCALERDEFRFAPPLNQSPLVPAKPGTQGPSTHSFQRLGPPLPRGRAEFRDDSNSTHPALDLHMAVHEAHHLLEHVAGLRKVGGVAGMPVALEIFERNLATGLAVGGDEALRLVAREIRLHVLVVMHHVAATLEPNRGRGRNLFAALKRTQR